MNYSASFELLSEYLDPVGNLDPLRSERGKGSINELKLKNSRIKRYDVP